LDMRTAADDSSTHYGDSGAFGYQIVFNNDNTFTISRVDSLGPNVKSWGLSGPSEWSSYDVGSATVIETKAVPSNGVIYTDDRMWVYGDIRDRVTVAAGVFPDTPVTNVDIILNGNTSYGGVRDGSRAFAVVAQRHVLIPWSGAPNDMVLEGAFIAQKGSFYRRYYPSNGGAGAHRLKNSLTLYGMFASNGIPVTAWVNGSGTVVSGFQLGQSSYDPNFGKTIYYNMSVDKDNWHCTLQNNLDLPSTYAEIYKSTGNNTTMSDWTEYLSLLKWRTTVIFGFFRNWICCSFFLFLCFCRKLFMIFLNN